MFEQTACARGVRRGDAQDNGFTFIELELDIAFINSAT